MISHFMFAFFEMPGATWPDALVPMQYPPAVPARVAAAAIRPNRVEPFIVAPLGLQNVGS
jgi:hypothetical protein